MKDFTRKLQTGQSMVEYIVILAALSAALLAPGLGSIGTSQTDQNSLLKAVANKHRGHAYALSLSEIPETDVLADLSVYYDSLGKYPQLSAQLNSGSGKLGKFAGQLTTLGNSIKQLDPSKLPNPAGLNPFGGVPSFP